MLRKWQREIRNADLQAQEQAASRHTYGLETQPPEAPPICPHCTSMSLHPLPSGKVLCHGCGRCWAESELR